MIESEPELESDDRYEGDWVYWAPGASLHSTRHDAVGAAAIFGRELAPAFDSTPLGKTKRVNTIRPYRCDLCHQAYSSAEEYRDHLEFYQQYAEDHSEYENEHPAPDEEVAVED